MICSKSPQLYHSPGGPSVDATESANVRQPPTMKPLQAIRCTHPSCRCECFAPGKQNLRYCDTCTHGWVAHALDKLGTSHAPNIGLQVEIVQPNIAFDIASLMLYGAHATPVRLKILLDRLFSVLQHEEVLQILHGFGWTYEDYARGYILQDNTGRVLDKWCVATYEEELVVLQQFLRFGETKTIAQAIIVQDTKDRHEVLIKQTPSAESDIKKFIERSNLSMHNYMKSYESTRQLFGARSVPFIPPTNMVMPPSLISPNYNPGRGPEIMSLPHAPIASSSPLRVSPLSRLHLVQHYDAHKEQPSPVINSTLEGSNICRSPKCESPQNLSKTSTVVSLAPSSTHALQPHHYQQQQDLDEVDCSDPFLSESEEDGEVLDYSNKENPDSLTDEDKRSKQHIRKSTNPVKRQWTPSVNFGNTFVGPNGKKRVLCSACNKTFCDKGALKIHYSAVHLKEMHKCTVGGCSMMFSSRRSRNRHSANPNPKLHMPQTRKDELDHTEELDISKLNETVTSSASTTPTKTIPSYSPVSSIHSHVPHIVDSPLIRRPDGFFIEMSTRFPFLGPAEKKIRLGDDYPADMNKMALTGPPDDQPCDLSKKLDGDIKLQIDLDKCSDEKEEVTDNERENEAGVKTNSEWGMKGGKRRKNSAPTRCAQSGGSLVTGYVLSGDKINKVMPLLELGNDGKQVVNERTYLLGLKKEQEEEGSEHEEDSLEKLTEGSEAKNFPKIASLLWANGTSTHAVNVPEDALDIESTEQSDEDSTKDVESTKWKSSGASECESSEDKESSTSRDAIQDCPAKLYVEKEHPLECKLYSKVFQNVQHKVVHSCTVDGCSGTFPSKCSQNRHIGNVNLHHRALAEVSDAKDADVSLRQDILATLYGTDFIHASVAVNTVPDACNNDRKSTNNNSTEHRGRNEGSFHAINNGKVSNFSANNALKLTIQQSLNGEIGKEFKSF